MRVAQRVHHLHLVDDLVHLALLDALDRDVVHRLLLAPLEDLRLPPRADLVKDVILVLRPEAALERSMTDEATHHAARGDALAKQMKPRAPSRSSSPGRARRGLPHHMNGFFSNTFFLVLLLLGFNVVEP